MSLAGLPVPGCVSLYDENDCSTVSFLKMVLPRLVNVKKIHFTRTWENSSWTRIKLAKVKSNPTRCSDLILENIKEIECNMDIFFELPRYIRMRLLEKVEDWTVYDPTEWVPCLQILQFPSSLVRIELSALEWPVKNLTIRLPHLETLFLDAGCFGCVKVINCPKLLCVTSIGVIENEIINTPRLMWLFCSITKLGKETDLLSFSHLNKIKLRSSEIDQKFRNADLSTLEKLEHVEIWGSGARFQLPTSVTVLVLRLNTSRYDEYYFNLIGQLVNLKIIVLNSFYTKNFNCLDLSKMKKLEQVEMCSSNLVLKLPTTVRVINMEGCPHSLENLKGITVLEGLAVRWTPRENDDRITALVEIITSLKSLKAVMVNREVTSKFDNINADKFFKWSGESSWRDKLKIKKYPSCFMNR